LPLSISEKEQHVRCLYLASPEVIGDSHGSVESLSIERDRRYNVFDIRIRLVEGSKVQIQIEPLLRLVYEQGYYIIKTVEPNIRISHVSSTSSHRPVTFRLSFATPSSDIVISLVPMGRDTACPRRLFDWESFHTSSWPGTATTSSGNFKDRIVTKRSSSRPSPVASRQHRIRPLRRSRL